MITGCLFLYMKMKKDKVPGTHLGARHLVFDVLLNINEYNNINKV